MKGKSSLTEDQQLNSEMFQYWDCVLTFGVLFLTFKYSIRSRNFKLYIACLEEIMPYVFQLNHTHYSRWLSVHLEDLKKVQISHPDIYVEFSEHGNFTVSRTGRPFSAMALDQAYEQLNKDIKSLHGALGTDIGDRWNMACPEVLRLLSEYENCYPEIFGEKIDSDPTMLKHHSDHIGHQKSFLSDFRLLKSAIQERCDPFASHPSLVCLNNRQQVPSSKIVSLFMKNLVADGKERYGEFVMDRLVTCRVPLTDALTTTNILLPGYPEKLKTTTEHLSVVQEVKLLSKLKDVSQKRPEEALEALHYEYLNIPACLTKDGEAYRSSKSKLLDCLRKVATVDLTNGHHSESVVIDLSCIVTALCHGKYFKMAQFYKAVWDRTSQLGAAHLRIDIVTDNYKEDNILKEFTRQGRGSGSMVNFTPEDKFPCKFADNLMKVNENKCELYEQLISFMFVQSRTCSKQYVLTKHDKVLQNLQGITDIVGSSQLEADYRIVLHILDALKKFDKVTIISNDTDVVIIVTAFLGKFREVRPGCKIYVITGVNQSNCIDIDLVAGYIGMDRTLGLVLLHSLSGCDFTESFYGRGKSAWLKEYVSNNEAGTLFSSLVKRPSLLMSEFSKLENFVLKVYRVANPEKGSAVARLELLSSNITTLRSLPPSKPALFQHAKRSLYVASFLWMSAAEPYPDLPDPVDWGWKQEEGKLLSVWTNRIYTKENDEFKKLMRSCSCRVGSSCNRCKCTVCWSQCGCKGGCS